MSTVAQEIQAVRRVLLGAYRPVFNTLSGAINSSVTTLTLGQTVRGVGPGTYLGIDDEIVYVWSLAGQVATVQREMLGTTGAAHSDGALIEVDPRFPTPLIREEMKAEIASWPRAIFTIDTDDLSFGAGDTMIAFAPTGLIDVLRVNRQPVDTTDDRYPDVGFDYKRSLGRLFIDSTGSANQSFTITVTYSKKFTTSTFTDATDLQATVGLTEPLEDALKYGACWRLLVGREVKRTFNEAQGDPRLSEEVPPGHANSVADAFLKIRNQRLTDEARRLAGEYPWLASR